ncbi:MAG: hypothetical protein RR954_07135 [Christensenellaceae bacterium]
MKIEMGESLILSWLRHIKECQIVQTNWKPSTKWELCDVEQVDRLKSLSDERFRELYQYDLYKGNSSILQIIAQAEIDVIGLNFDHGETKVYAVDVAFHEAGLNYGSREETVARVIKKCLRTAMCVYGYLGISSGSIIFASPKINPAVYNDLQKVLPAMEEVLKAAQMPFDVRIICNEDFKNKILEPVMHISADVADTSELFMRSLQMVNLFSDSTPFAGRKLKTTSTKFQSAKGETFCESDSLSEMKIGVIVRTILKKILEQGSVSEEEVKRMQTKEYSKENFDIQYPLLLPVQDIKDGRPARYYSTPITVHGNKYFLCSEWFEVPANNDRPYLLKWLALHPEHESEQR